MALSYSLDFGNITPSLEQLTKGLPEVALEAAADYLPVLLGGDDSLVPIDTGLMRDSFETEVQGDALAITNGARNPRTGSEYAAAVEAGIPAPRTKGKVLETLVTNVDKIEERMEDAVAEVLNG